MRMHHMHMFWVKKKSEYVIYGFLYPSRTHLLWLDVPIATTMMLSFTHITYAYTSVSQQNTDYRGKQGVMGKNRHASINLSCLRTYSNIIKWSNMFTQPHKLVAYYAY